MNKLLFSIPLIFILLLSGCATINVYQKLYRNGEFDLTFEVISDNQFTSNALKESVGKEFKGGSYIETSNGFKYILEKADINKVLGQNNISITDNLGIKKEFKFPYYYYTLTLKNEGIADPKYGSMGVSCNYIIEPFGKITDTNGIYFGDGKRAVEFDLMKSNDYYVTFRDFFISSWFGGASKIINKEAKDFKFNINGSSEIEAFNGLITTTTTQSPATTTTLQQFKSNVYSEADIDSAINLGTTLKDDQAWTSFVRSYLTDTPDGWYSILTPYGTATSYVRDSIVKYDNINRTLVSGILQSNHLAVIIYLGTNKDYSYLDTNDIRIIFKDGDQIYRAQITKVNSEYKSTTSNSNWDYTTNIQGDFTNYEDLAKKTMDLILVLDGKETKFSVDLSKYK